MMNTEPVIQKIGPEALAELRPLAVKTFFDAFAAFNTEENMRQYLEEALSETQLAEELRDPNSLFYFARIDGTAAAYMKLNLGPAQTDLYDPRSLEIQRIYVLSTCQNLQIGKKMLAVAEEAARAHALEYLWLAVWDQNPGAIRFYEKNGFARFGTKVFVLGSDEQKDILMKKAL